MAGPQPALPGSHTGCRPPPPSTQALGQPGHFPFPASSLPHGQDMGHDGGSGSHTPHALSTACATSPDTMCPVLGAPLSTPAPCRCPRHPCSRTPEMPRQPCAGSPPPGPSVHSPRTSQSGGTGPGDLSPRTPLCPLTACPCPVGNDSPTCPPKAVMLAGRLAGQGKVTLLRPGPAPSVSCGRW